MKYGIFYDKQPLKFLKKQNKDTARRVFEKIELLGDTPMPTDAKSIVGEHGVFRIRIGDYRAVYRINYSENKIIIFKIDKRERIY